MDLVFLNKSEIYQGMIKIIDILIRLIIFSRITLGNHIKYFECFRMLRTSFLSDMATNGLESESFYIFEKSGGQVIH